MSATSSSAATSDLVPTGTLRATFIATNPVQGIIDAKTGAIRNAGLVGVDVAPPRGR